LGSGASEVIITDSGGSKPPGGLPLSGVLIIALEQYLSAPYCTMLLGDMGAEVVKIERPKSGEPYRLGGHTVRSKTGYELNSDFLRANRGKKSVTLDIHTARGRELLLRLLEKADLLVENLRPGRLRDLSLDFPSLHSRFPGLIYTSISGFGREDVMPGPYSDWPAFDQAGQAMSGVMHLARPPDQPPRWLNFGLADIHTGTVAALGSVLALLQRVATGVGQHVDIAIYDSSVPFAERSILERSLTGRELPPGREVLRGPNGVYEADDGFVTISVITDELWQRLCAAMGRDDLAADPRLSQGPARATVAETRLRPEIESWLKGKSRDQAVHLLIAAGVPAASVQTVDELFSCKQVAAREMLVELPGIDSALPVMVAGNPIKLSSAAPRIGATPGLGEHTAEILTEALGLSADELQSLRISKII
jgi:CoA:oxalate CoA-transferase